MPYKKISGIYKITNIINNKVYIGSAVSIFSRLSIHKNQLKNNKHFNNHLQASWNKYGEENFKFELLEECLLELLQDKEEYHIQLYKANNNIYGFNKRINCKTNLGIKASLETKEKLRISHLGHKRTKETHEKIIQSQYVKVCQYDINGNYLNTFNSMLEASEKTGIGKTLISMVCRKVIPWTKKTFWCYEIEKNNFVIPKILKKTKGYKYENKKSTCVPR